MSMLPHIMWCAWSWHPTMSCNLFLPQWSTVSSSSFDRGRFSESLGVMPKWQYVRFCFLLWRFQLKVLKMRATGKLIPSLIEELGWTAICNVHMELGCTAICSVHMELGCTAICSVHMELGCTAICSVYMELGCTAICSVYMEVLPVLTQTCIESRKAYIKESNFWVSL